ncbi:hypothetical protein [Rhizobium ruizarguesonis]|uniref:hypothetical protein n=1 Tax=Rhizobium ruizarguesonis TaxID=2081791 RepID=UPI0013BC3648|nr:hypothetical protein [Rhizobium ruizarguesonis]NEJ64887.1 hypothetical protein [Rhizobium ruizarguesonis]
MSSVDSLVLSTVNAPYSKKLDAMTLANYILEPAKSKTAAGPMSSFFYEVSPDLQFAFAETHGISIEALKVAAVFFDAWSGQKSVLAA